MSAITDPRQAGERLLTFAREGRLVQGSWITTLHGRDFACLLGAAAGIDDASDCPASLMPEWVAKLLPGLFDGQRDSQAQTFARRFGEAMVHPGWASNRWDRVKDAFLALCVQQAQKAAADADANDFAYNFAAASSYFASAASYANNVADAARAGNVADAATDAAKAAHFAKHGAADARAAQADCLMTLIEQEVARG